MIEFFLGGPNSRVNGEISQSVDNDPFKKSVVINFSVLMMQLLSAVFLYIEGHFMEISKSFLK